MMHGRMCGHTCAILGKTDEYDFAQREVADYCNITSRGKALNLETFAEIHGYMLGGERDYPMAEQVGPEQNTRR